MSFYGPHTKEAKLKISNFQKVHTSGIGIRFKKGQRPSLATEFKKGQKAWNKGLHTGISPWLGKSRPKGEKSTNWKGGVTPISKLKRAEFRRTMQKQVFARDNYTCQMCGTKGDLQVDHIQSWVEYVEGRFNINNCRTLCMDCHYLITYGRPKPKGLIWGHNFKSYVRGTQN